MSGRPTAAAEMAGVFMELGLGTPAQAAREYGLSVSQTRRIARRLGLPPQPRGRPRSASVLPQPGHGKR